MEIVESSTLRFPACPPVFLAGRATGPRVKRHHGSVSALFPTVRVPLN